MGLYVPSFRFLNVLFIYLFIYFQFSWFECCVIQIGAALPILVLRCMNIMLLLISLFQEL